MHQITDLLTQYERYLRHERQASEATIASYLSDLRVLAEEINKPVEQIELNDFRRHVANLSEQGRKQSTIERKIAGYRTFWKWLILEKIIVENVPDGISIKKRPRPIPKWLSEDDLRTFVQTPDDNPRNQLAWTLLAWLGLRRSEILNMRIKDIHIGDRTLLIRNSKGNKDRLLLLPESLIEQIEQHITGRKDEDYVFKGDKGGQWSVQSFTRAFNRHLDRCGLFDKGITAHTLRHTFATHLVRRGVPITDVKALLGHADIKTTIIYLHSDQSQMRRAMNKHPLNEIDHRDKG